MLGEVSFRGRVVEARYSHADKSILLVIEDEDTKERVPAKLPQDTFQKKRGQNLAREMEKLAQQLRSYPHPITIQIPTAK